MITNEIFLKSCDSTHGYSFSCFDNHDRLAEHKGQLTKKIDQELREEIETLKQRQIANSRHSPSIGDKGLGWKNPRKTTQ